MITGDIGEIATPENDPSSLGATFARTRGPGSRAREGAAARKHAEQTYDAPVVAER